MENRRLRTRPSPRSPVVLSDRDARILLALAECSFLTTAQLARDGFSSEDRCRKRLRKLYDARLTNVLMTGSRDSNVIQISRLGLQALRDLGHDISGLSVPAAVRTSALPHILLTNDARLYLANFALEGLGELRAWESGRGSVAAKIGLAAARIAPDAIAITVQNQSEKLLIIESDCGFETSALVDKLKRYAAWKSRPQNAELWIIAAGDAARIRYVQAMCASIVPGWTRLFRHEQILMRPAVEPASLVRARRT